MSSTTPSLSSPKADNTKQSLGEKIMSFIFDGPPGTKSSKNARDLRDKAEEDKLGIPRTAKEEKHRQRRIKQRAEIVGGGDGVRTNDMQKGGWGGAMLGAGNGTR